MTHRPIRVPGFPEPPARPEGPPAAEPADPSPTLAPAPLDRRAGVRQLNVRVLIPLLQRYQRLLRALDDEGFDTSMAELTQALLHDGPTTTAEARHAVRAWRRALDPEA